MSTPWIDGARYEVNGVFEGGGAKGVAYVGALRACHEAGLEFRAVAGSSAGAITAALVASGHGPDAIEELLGRALASFGRRSGAVLSLRRRSMLRSAKLRSWLSATIDARLTELGHPDADPDRTFRGVEAATGIALYVVAMDLGSRQPIVFCPTLTPDVAVADAVMASSAIPVAFPAQRVEIDGEVRRLADGGVYANYPSFVFLDDEFRHCFGLPERERDRATIGFVLDEADASVHHAALDRDQLARIRTMPDLPGVSDHGGAGRELGAFGGFATSPLVQLAAVLLPLALVLLGNDWLHREMDGGMPTITRLPRGLQDIALIALTAGAALLVGFAVAMAFVVVRIGRALLDEGLVGASAAMGVGPNVPYWIGANPTAADLSTRSHVVVRIPLPAGLKTLGFSMKPEVRRAAVEQGHRAALTAFERYAIPWSGADRPEGAPPAAAVAGDRHRSQPPPRSRVRGLASAALAMVLFSVGFIAAAALSLAVLRSIFDRAVPWWQLGLLLPVTAALVGFHAVRRHRRASGSSVLERLPLALLAVLTVASAAMGVALVARVATSGNNAALNIGDQLYAASFTGTVLRSADRGDGAFFGQDVDVAIADPSEIATEALQADIDRGNIRPCDEPDVSQCYVFRSQTALEEGEQQLRYVDTRGVVVREDDLSLTPFTDAAVLVSACPFLVFATRGGWTWWSRRRHRRFRNRRTHAARVVTNDEPTAAWAPPAAGGPP